METVDGAAIAAIEQRLGVDHSQVTVIRHRLIERGLLVPTERGVLGCTLPGMAAWVRDAQPAPPPAALPRASAARRKPPAPPRGRGR